MAELLLNFNQDINFTAQVGDTAYYLSLNDLSNSVEKSFSVQDSSVLELGTITYISPNRRTLGLEVQGSSVSADYLGKFIMFNKDNTINTSSPSGYFAKARLVNDSKVLSEIFSISCDVFESSK